tara:strand:- start:649 stop:1002 length:354 start_codon:yes stop_codon:yes gene_type:complete
MYLKEKYNNVNVFEQTKIVYSLYKDSFIGSLNKELKSKILFDEINDTNLSIINTPNAKNLHKLAITYSDFVLKTKLFNNKDIFSFIKSSTTRASLDECQTFEETIELYNNLCAAEVV